ncbi:hypothetical protein ACFSUK_33595 [Sphingobium scionense]
MHHHLASLDRFRALVDRQALRLVAEPSSSGASNEPATAEADAPAKSNKSRKVVS